MRGELAPDPWVGWRPSPRLRSAAPAATIAVVAAALVACEPTAAVTTFATVFLGAFFEALPFLLLGVLVSVIVQKLGPPSLVTRVVPRGRLRAALAGAACGAIFPVCECGVVPVARRLLDKGAILSVPLTMALAALVSIRTSPSGTDGAHLPALR